jgi:hypothetical protein
MQAQIQAGAFTLRLQMQARAEQRATQMRRRGRKVEIGEVYQSANGWWRCFALVGGKRRRWWYYDGAWKNA